MKNVSFANTFWGKLSAGIALAAILSSCAPVGFSMDDKAVGASGNPADDIVDGSCIKSIGETCGEAPPPPVPVNESITTQTTNKIDVLVVIDNSGSMDNERAALGNRLRAFLTPLQGLDWQLCVTTSDVGRENGQPIRFPNGSRVLNSSTANAEAEFLEAVTEVGSGSGNEEPVRAQVLAFRNPSSECYRADAALVSVSLTDEDERSTGGYSKYRGDSQFRELSTDNLSSAVVEAVQSTWGRQKVFSAHSIVIKSGDQACYDQQRGQNNNAYFGTRLEQLAAATDGKVGNICAADYSSQMTTIGDHVRTTTKALTLKCAPLSTPTVQLPPMYSGTQVTNSGDKLYFNPELPAGVQVTVSYMCPGK
jgi:hypothetical protein